MSTRWQYKVAEVALTVLGGKATERTQEALDKLGAQGWELVAVTQPNPAGAVRLYLKRPA